MAANGGSDRLPGAVPMLCNPGDVAINNRQVVHGAFANESEDSVRVTLVFGFHRRSSLLGVTRGDPPVTYDAARIHQRSRIIALAVDARQQRFPHEQQLPLPAAGGRARRQPLDRGHARIAPPKLRHHHHVHLSGNADFDDDE